MSQPFPGSELPSPPLESEPEPPPLMMSNPVLSRRRPVRRQTNAAWYVGIPVAVIVLGVAAYFVSTSMSKPSLLTNETTTQTASTTQTAAPAPAAAPAPTPTPAPAPAQLATAAPTTEQPVAPPREITPNFTRRVTTHRAPVRRAPSAAESGADVSATAPQTLTPPPAAQSSTPPPTITPPGP